MNTEEIIQELKQQLRIGYNRWLSKGKQLTMDFTAKNIRSLLEFMEIRYSISEQEKEEIFSQLQTWSANYKFKVKVEQAYIISAEGAPNIVKIKDTQSEITWDAWNRYAAFLESEKGFEYPVIDNIKRTTLDIIERLPSPRKNRRFDCRGLVVGDVQSGKTANYSGLLARAADAGYRVIIVAAGGTNALRKQTQMRLERDFADRNSDTHAGGTRVGAYGEVPYTLDSWTSVDRDFTGSNSIVNYAALNDDNVVFMVVKKNGTVLKRIIETFKTMRNQTPTAFSSSALLFIDDEADYASVNANEDDNPTVINDRIREILHMFDKSAYVGYTATPYANVFIAPSGDEEAIQNEDLFPRDFICCLGSPDNYQGASKLFLASSTENHTIQSIDAEDDFKRRLKKSATGKVAMPASLENALCAYILAHAIIRCRKELSHLEITGMLIHVDRLKTGHEKLKKLVERKFSTYKAELGINAWGEISEQNLPCLARLQKVWNEQYEGKQTPECTVTWTQVRQQMCNEDFLNEFDILAVNGEGDDLDYNNYTKAALICIGGDKLARGLTLEGLVTTYFLRSSRQYDTLMQMGRWFGYRPGYEDICRVYMPEEIRLYFSEIAAATEELKYSFERMNQNEMTPLEFGLKVRNNVSGLLITGPKKMRNAQNYTEFVSTSAGFHFTNYIPAEDGLRERANSYYRDFIRTLHEVPGVHSSVREHAFLWEDVPAEKVLAFLKDLKEMKQNIYRTGNFFLDAENIINEALEKEGVVDVSLVKLVKSTESHTPVMMDIQGSNQPISFGFRSKAKLNADGMYSFEKNNSTSPVDERGGLTDKEISDWKERTWSDERKASQSSLSRMDYRNCRGSIPDRNKPLLILTGYYVPAIDEDGRMNTSAVKFISACGLSFPDSDSTRSGTSRTVRYMYNKVALDKLEEQIQKEQEETEE